MIDLCIFGSSDTLIGSIRVIPIEVDDHFCYFGKEPWDVEYGDECTLCKSRIDEFLFCSCGVGGE